MSDYLIHEMRSTRNISIEFGCEIVDGGGNRHLEWITIEERETGVKRRVDACALFILIGAVPSTAWLSDELAKDQWGFVLTGRDVQDSSVWPLDCAPYAFETSLPGVLPSGTCDMVP